jgi:integrase
VNKAVPRLTPISIENIKPRAARYAVSDSGCRGLYLNVYPSGRKSWSVRYRLNGHTCNFTLDGFLPLALARKAATQALAEVAEGKDPAAAKAAAKAKAQILPSGRDTVGRLAEQFIQQHVRRNTRPNSARATDGIFRNIVLPAWGARNVRDISRRDVIDLIEGVAADRPIAANRTKAAVSKFFAWLTARDVIQASPCVGVPSPSRERARDRILSDDELIRLWRAAEAIGGRASSFIKLLILLGQRRSEISNLLWRECNGDLLTIGAERMKGRMTHIVPLSSQAASIIASMSAGRPDETVLGLSENYTRLKRALDTHMGDAPPWVFHDVRRGVASGMARIGVAVPVIEKLLAHRSGTFRGVVATYQRHSFLPEMSAAVQRWGDHIERLVGGKPAKVVKLRRR